MQRLYATTRIRHESREFHSFWKSFVSLLLIAAIFTHSQIRASELPDLGNSANAVLTPSQERELGQSVMKQLQASMRLSQDAVLNEYLQGIGYRLIATQGQAQAPFQFFAVEDKSINAFALPGGFVGVNTGLILASDGESELAGVLAHEVAHVQQKHIARMYEHMGRLQLSTIAGLLAALIISTQNPQAGSGAMAATLAGSQQAMINFTRDHEKEADSFGIQSLAKAGFDPMGMPAFFHRMYQDTRYYGNHTPDYLMTHPLTESRLVAAQSRAKEYPYKQIPDSLQFHLVQARVLLHNFSSSQDAIAYFNKVLERGNYRNKTGTLYGYALALIESQKPLAAKPYLDELISSAPNQPLFQLAYAQMEISTQQVQSALNRLATTLKNHPSNYPVTMAYAEWLIKLGEPQKAISILKQQTSKKSSSPIVWKLLSNAFATNQQPIQSHLAQAQYLKLKGDFKGALTQLKLAKKLATSSPKEQRQIDIEMQEVQKQV